MTLSEELDNFKSGNLLVSTNLENYEQVFTDVLSYFVNKNISGVVLSLNKSCTALVKTFEANKIDTKSITFIDSITYNEEKRESNFIYLARPFNATTTSIVIDQLAQNSQNRFFIFDSLTTMLLSYDVMHITKFFQYNLPKLASKNKISIILAINVDTKDPNTNLVVKLCNKVTTV